MKLFINNNFNVMRCTDTTLCYQHCQLTFDDLMQFKLQSYMNEIKHKKSEVPYLLNFKINFSSPGLLK